MTDKETISARVPPDTNEQFEQYREERDLSKSDAGRRLIEMGLREEMSEEPDVVTDGGHSTPELVALNIMSTAAVVAAVGGVAGVCWALGIDLTPWALAGPLLILGAVALLVALAAGVVYGFASDRFSEGVLARHG